MQYKNRKCRNKYINTFIAVCVFFAFFNNSYVVAMEFPNTFDDTSINKKIIEYNITEAEAIELGMYLQEFLSSYQYAEISQSKDDDYNAIYYYKKSLDLFNKLISLRAYSILYSDKTTTLVPATYGLLYYNLGTTYFWIKDFRSALQYLEQAEKYKQYLTTTQQYYLYSRICLSHYALGNVDASLDNAIKAKYLCQTTEQCRVTNNFINSIK